MRWGGAMKQRLLIYLAFVSTGLTVVSLIYWPDIQEIRGLKKNNESTAAISQEWDIKSDQIIKKKASLESQMAAQAVTFTNKELIEILKETAIKCNISQPVENPQDVLLGRAGFKNVKSILKLTGQQESQRSIEFFQVNDRDGLYYIVIQPSGDELFFEMSNDSVKIEKFRAPFEGWVDFFTALKIKKVFQQKTSISEDLSHQLVTMRRIHLQNVYRKILASQGCLPFVRISTAKPQKICRPLTEKEFPYTEICKGSELGLWQIQSAITARYECNQEEFLEGFDSCDADQDCKLVEKGPYRLFTNLKHNHIVDGLLTEASLNFKCTQPIRKLKSTKCFHGHCSGLFYPEGYQK
jgi:hypothetical protein